MAIQCRVQEVIEVLVELGLPKELAWELVYKWKVVEHPTAIALKTDPWLRRVREQFDWPDKRDVPNTTTCVCPRNHTDNEGFDWESGLIHRYYGFPHYWSLMSPHAKAWMERVHGPPNNPHDIMTVRCPRSILCMRYYRHTMPLLDARIRNGRVGVIDQGTRPGADCVTNEDYSLATWLQHAPPRALKEYLQGVAGWSKEKMDEALDWRHGDWYVSRQDIVRMCLEH
jgi:hypothetical protein